MGKVLRIAFVQVRSRTQPPYS